jgi:threonine/homoserine/homoserine lactone efflux protein
MLEGVGDADRERLGVHGEQGEERFDLALAKVAGHDLAHLNQLARTVAAGVATGQAVWTLATGVGVAELLQASEPAFLVMKTAGAAYLVFLGLQSLWAAARVRFPGRLGLVFCPMTFGWLALYSVAVDRARVMLGRSWVRRVLDGVSGVVLVGFGARLALQQR